MISYEVPRVTTLNAASILEDANLTADDLPEAHAYGSRIVRAAQVLREAEKMAKRKATEVS